ncbi:MAG: hypothetical protein OEZ10_07985, partial [Gammaproteobacteria bacterium]|nr:hypothetical protein [Gammaproteobacteria bacterium]
MKKLFYLFSIIAMVVLASNVQEIEANDDVICGKSLLNIKSVNEYNGISTRLFISDKHGKLIFPVIRHPGSIITLCKKKKFLLIDTNSNYVPTESFLMSSDMAVLRVFKFGEVTTFGKSKDENIFWVQYFSSVDKIPL